MPKTVEDNESRLNELRSRLATLDRERAEVTKRMPLDADDETPWLASPSRRGQPRVISGLIAT
jgi:hypothetical protein